MSVDKEDHNGHYTIKLTGITQRIAGYREQGTDSRAQEKTIPTA